MTESPGATAPAEQPAGQPSDEFADQPPARRRGMGGSTGDMVRSMAVIVAVVGLLLLIVPRPNGRPVQSIDVSSAAAGAQRELGFAPTVPGQLPDGWTAETAEVQRATGDLPTWHLVYLTPSGTYAGVQEAANATAAWEAKQVTDGADQGVHQVAGHSWVVRSRTDRGITSWVLRGSGRTTIVTGTASTADLDQFASALDLP